MGSMRTPNNEPANRKHINKFKSASFYIQKKKKKNQNCAEIFKKRQLELDFKMLLFTL